MIFGSDRGRFTEMKRSVQVRACSEHPLSSNFSWA